MERRSEIKDICDELGVEPVIGAETHITLNTKTKLNCSCDNTDVDTANKHICPVCSGQPGAMPEVNASAVEKTIKLGKAIDAEISNVLLFDRKHYEYPDLPSGFQRTQYYQPILHGGTVKTITLEGEDVDVELDRIHLEEDAGKLTHDKEKKKSYIDYNRAGRPLIEVVTQPTIHNIPELIAYLKQLQRLVKTLDVSEAELAKGFFKSDISISLREKGSEDLNKRTEIKNLNSFNSIEAAVSKELLNQLDYRKRNNAPKSDQVTVLYEEETGKMRVMREKEEESDYRFMHEANIPAIDISTLIEEVEIDVEYLPYAVERALVDVGIRPQDATYFTSDLIRAQRLLEINEQVEDLEFVAKQLMNNVKDEWFEKIDIDKFVKLLLEYKDNKLFSSSLLEDTIQELIMNPNMDMPAYLDDHIVSDEEALYADIEQILEDEQDIVEEIQAGNRGKIGTLVGKVMRSQDKKVPGSLVKSKIEAALGIESADISSTKEKRERTTERIDVDAANKDRAYLAQEYKTHSVKEISQETLGETVVLAGWIQSVRDHGNLVFIDLRDDNEIFQVKLTQEKFENIDDLARLKDETVIQVKGEIAHRDEDDYHPTLRTGTIELEATDLKVLSFAQQVPFEISRAHAVNESQKLAYRYLALRNEHIRNNIENRFKTIRSIREYLEESGFMEVETPMLTKGTDEGSREFIVPSRLHPGQFYSLPQAPQQFKQLLMLSGIDKYYQIARCFRDEDTRGDRQPEFTQVDLEMAFVSEEDVMELVSKSMLHLIKQVYPSKKLLFDNFPKISYEEAMRNYGTDKPDIRFDMKFTDITDTVRQTDFNVFRKPIEAGGIVKCIKVDGDDAAEVMQDGTFFSRKYKEGRLIDICKQHDLPGLAYLEVHGDTLHPNMNVSKLGEDVCWEIVEKTGAKDGDTLFFAASEEKIVHAALDAVRRELGNKLNLYKDNELAFCRVVDFPMFEKTEDGEWKFTHNPFSMPKIDHVDWLLKGENIENIEAQQYDLVLNGHEIGGGSIRAHLPHILKATYKTMGYTDREIKDSIGHILTAFSYGPPPHGGIALGLDRILMILQRQASIRDVMAFPKTGDGRDLLMDAPSELSDDQLDDVHIKSTGKEGY